MDLCLECKACKAECPSNVDMAKLKYEYLAHYHREHGYPLRSYLFGYIGLFARLGSALAPVSNWIAGSGPSRWFLDRFLGLIVGGRYRGSLRSRFRNGLVREFLLQKLKRGKSSSTTIHLPSTRRAANSDGCYGIAQRAGYEVVLVENKVCCGRPMISKGFLEQARDNARQNIEALLPYAEKGIPIIGIEPSCILTLRDDYRDLVPGQGSQRLADSVYMRKSFPLRGLGRVI